MKLFDRDGNGSEEITAAVGIISNGITFDKWRPLIPFGIRDVVAIVGREPVEARPTITKTEKATTRLWLTLWLICNRRWPSLHG